MRKILPFLFVLGLAVSAYAVTLTQARDAANAILAPWYSGTVVPAQEAYMDAHGHYAQCVMGLNIPAAVTADAVVAELVGDRYAEVLSDQAESCIDVLGAALTLPKPFLFWADTLYDRNHGYAVVSCIVLRFDVTLYKRCQELHRPDSGPQATCSPSCLGFPELQHSWAVWTP